MIIYARNLRLSRYPSYHPYVHLISGNRTKNMMMIYFSLQVIKKFTISKSCSLRIRNLHVNKTKTEEYEIKQNRNESQKECELSRSLLDTDKAISRKKSSLVPSIKNLKYIYLLQSKHSIVIKNIAFNCYKASIANNSES